MLIKIGNFYEIFDIDSLIMNKLFGYIISAVKDIFKCGFPIKSINNVIEVLDASNINYLVIGDDIKAKKEVEGNNYSSYNFDINIHKYNYSRINKIVNYLNDKMSSDISDKIDLIEEVLFM